MNRKMLSTACAVALIVAVAIAPSAALARPVRTAPSLDLGIDVTAPPTGSSFTPTGGTPPSGKPLPQTSGDISALAADTFPGDPVQWIDAWQEPIIGTVDTAGINWNYFTIYLEAGEAVDFELYGPDVDANFDLFLYDPAGLPAQDDDGNDLGADEWISGIANVAGIWSIGVQAVSGSGTYELYGLFESPDDNVPAVPIPPTRVQTWLDSYSDWDDVYRVWLNAGDVLTLSLTRGSTFTAGFYPNLYLYAPGTANVWDEAAIAGAEGTIFPKTITYGVPSSGYYYVDIYEFAATHEQGEAYLSWKVSSPVYRFYNFTNNTHFFTPSLDEANMVLATWSNVFRYEGVAYYTNPANNTQPLYRFYNRVSKSHFYTASLDEANTILLRYSATYTLDGQTYAVNPAPVAGSSPVYRFYNLRNGSHFYTASAEEADMVIATWPSVYRFEGAAFWIGQ
ncbi:MAG: hypothetical protein Q7W51_10070 [Coriobacteriia bacterium]|nr:hypothetical protein [Coriobacteriia bacterium]